MTGLRRMQWMILVATLVLCGCKTTPNAVLRQRGYEALEAREVDVARGLFAQAAQQDPTDWKAQYYLGKILVRQGRPLDGQLALEKALSLRPDQVETPGIIDDLCEALFQQKRFEALHALLASAATDFGQVHDYLRQGDYLALMNEADGARLAYQKAAAFAKAGDAEPYVRMAAFYESIGDVPNAVLALRQAHYVQPDNLAIANKLREYDIVPGPAAALKPRQSR